MADQKPHKRGATQKAPSTAAAPSAKAASPAPKRSQLRAKPAASMRKPERTKPRRSPLKALAIVLGCLVALALVSGVAIAVLAHTSAFSIASIDAVATEHLSSSDIASLAGVPEGTTLLNYDEEAIRQNVRRNPWVDEVGVSREFPDRLRVTVSERKVGMIVMLDSGRVIWCMGTDGVWIEPVKVVTGEDQSIREAALGVANSMGALLVTDAPQTVSPVAGEHAEDDVFDALRTYRSELSPSFWEQIVSVSAPSVEAISCILQSGVEVSLGAPTGIESKELVVQQLLAKYPNRITYINVRVPSSPSYRMLDSEAVQEGTGAYGDAKPQA